MTTDIAQTNLGDAIQRLDELTMYLPTAFHDVVQSQTHGLILGIRDLGRKIEGMETQYCEVCNSWRTSQAHHQHSDYGVDPVLEQEKLHDEWREAERIIHGLG